MSAYSSLNSVKLTSSGNTFVVQRAGNDRLQNDIVDLITSRHSSITREEAISLLESYASTIEMLLKADNRMYTSLYNNISRILISFRETSLPDKRSGATVTPLLAMKQADQPSELPQSGSELPGPVLSRCHNVVSNTRTVMSGSVIQLYGSSLEFDKSDSKQGVFMIDATGSAMKATTLVRLKTDNIIFMVPGGLAAGEYKLEVRKVCTQTGKMQTGLLPGILTVVI